MFNFEAFNCLLQTIQTMFNTYWFGQTQNQTMRSNGFLAFLMSGENRRSIEVLNNTLQDPNGVRRTVTLKNRSPFCFQLACAPWNCETPVQKILNTPDSVNIVLDGDPCWLYDPAYPGVPVVPGWNPKEFRELCEDQPMLLAQTVAELVDNLEYELEKKYLEELATNIVPESCDADGNTRPSIKLFHRNLDSPDAGFPNGLVFHQIAEQFRKTFTAGSYAILGGGRMKAYMDRRGIRNGGSFFEGNVMLPTNDGNSPWRFYYSWAYDQVFENNSFITIRDGVIQLLEWSENKGYMSQMSDDRARWSTLETNLGLTLDMDWSKPISGTAIQCMSICYAIRHTGKIYVANGGGCDVLDCYNGVLYWTDCGEEPFGSCPVVPVCDMDASIVNSLTYLYQSSGQRVLEGTNNVFTLDGTPYAATPGSDIFAAVLEIQDQLRAAGFPTALVTYDATIDRIEVSGITGAGLSWSNSATSNTTISVVDSCLITAITTVGAETVTISKALTVLYTGDLSDMPYSSTGVAVINGVVYFNSCEIKVNPNDALTVLLQKPDCDDVTVGLVVGSPAINRADLKCNSNSITLEAGKYTNAQLLELAGVGTFLRSGPTSVFQLGNAYFDAFEVEVHPTNNKVKGGKVTSKTPCVEVGHGGAPAQIVNAHGKKEWKNRMYFDDVCVEIPAGVAAEINYTIKEKFAL